ncbi:metallophosphoesterase 1-like [Battus philenor]|uniref:metallophosphoesterase 1-like n=1 Tax=Battus philenor TaxID=42288 RepID=UPI0035CED78F
MVFILSSGQRNTFSVIVHFVVGVIFVCFYCEWMIYYVNQIQCGWPTLSKKPKDGLDPVHAMILADTHLYGAKDRFTLEDWRKEWQMKRAFQAAITIHQPELVFVLGDLFDDGKWSSQNEFNDNVKKFYSVFKVPEEITLYSVVGNHDIGLHFRITPQLVKRFEKKLNAPPVRVVSLRGNHFILINSMAMEGDGCSLCSRAVTEIDKIADILKCSSGSALCKSHTKLEQYSRPIVLQHFPLYRESDSVCIESDPPPVCKKSKLFEERRDCLSKESTEYLVESLLPRAAFGGHTHHSCLVKHSFAPTPDHKIEFHEYTVPSFSWRKRLDPKYYLVTVSPDEVKVSKCELPREWTIQVTAIMMLLGLVIYCKYFVSRPTPSINKLMYGKKF